MKKTKELMLGFFILGGVFILSLGLMFVKDFHSMRGSYTVKVAFNFANGIKVASPVRMAGVDIGEVERVELNTSGSGAHVIVVARINKGVKIPKKTV